MQCSIQVSAKDLYVDSKVAVLVKDDLYDAKSTHIHVA